MNKKIFLLGLIPLALSGCKELNDINWPDSVRAQLVKYNIVEPKVDPTLTKEVQTVPTPDAPSNEAVSDTQSASAPMSLPDIPAQRMDESGPIFERSVTTGEDALEALGKTQPGLASPSEQPTPAPIGPPNLFGTTLPQNPAKP